FGMISTRDLERGSGSRLLLFNLRLTGRIKASSRQSIKAALINRPAAAHTNSVRALVHPHQRLIDVGDHGRFAVAKFQSQLADDVAQRQVNAFLGPIICRIDSGGLFVAYLARVTAQICQQELSEVLNFIRVHRAYLSSFELRNSFGGLEL